MSIKRVLAALWQTEADALRLVKLELASVRERLLNLGAKLGRSAALGVAASLLAFFGLASLLSAAVVGLAIVIPLWLSFLLVGLGSIALAAAAALAARRGVKRALVGFSLVGHRSNDDTEGLQ